MPGWVNTPEEEKAWEKAKGIVARQRKKAEEDFENKDWGLVTHIAKNMLKASVSQSLPLDEGVLVALADVERLLDRRKKRERRSVDASLPADTQTLVRAISEVAALGSESIAALRTRRADEPADRVLLGQLRDTSQVLRQLLAKIKG